MNRFKRIVLTLLSGCLVLGGCGRTNESDSLPDGIVAIPPTTTQEVTEEDYTDPYEDEDDEIVRTTVRYTLEYQRTTTTVSRAPTYVATAAPSPNAHANTTAVSRHSSKTTTRTTAASGGNSSSRTTARTVRTAAPTTTQRTTTTTATYTTKLTTAPPVTTVTTTFSAPTPEDALKDMTLREKVSQMFIVTPEQLAGVSKATEANTTMKRRLADIPVGGILFGEDNIESKSQLTAMVRNIQSYVRSACGVGTVIAVSEAGGPDSPVHNKLDTTGFYEPAVYGLENDPDHVYEIGTIMGEDLLKSGFHLDLAPPAGAGSSGYNASPSVTADLVRSMIKGLRSSGMACAPGEFPGTDGDSDKSLAQLREEEFLPFKAAAEEEVGFIRMGHQKTAIDKDTPADLSAKAVKCLRDDVGFKGVIVSGRHDQSAITSEWSSGDAAVASVKAGVDMILVPKDLQEAADALCKAVEDGDIPESRIDESVLRILTQKKIMGLY